MAAPSLLFLLILATASSVDSSSQSSNGSCVPAERAALLSFKAGITGDPDNRLVSWRQGHHDCCRWSGVTCSSKTGHVVKLDLRNRSPMEEELAGFEDPRSRSHSLHGKVSLSLLGLRHSLRHLDLSANTALGGAMAMPGFLGSLHSLKYLNLSYMGFHGRVPPQLGNLSKLVQLDIGNLGGANNLYSSDISWLPRLHSLEHLNMASVNLTGVHDWVHMVNALPSLAVLILSSCLLNAPSTFMHHNLTFLEELDLSSNSFNSMAAPNWFWDVTSLKSLSLQDCGLLGMFPRELRNLTLLETFDISSNEIIGVMPARTLQNMCNLRSLWLGGINIGRDITEVIHMIPNCSWKNLQELNLEDASITGTTLQFVSNLTSLSWLDVHGNQLRGSVPMEIGMLPNLSYLDLGSNQLTGPLPVEIGKLTNLSYLDLGSNQLTGPLLVEIGKLTNLTDLDLGNNQLTGPLPVEIGKLTNLSGLDLGDNQLTGPLPVEIGKLTNLTSCVLGGNQLTGPVPVEIGKLTSLFILFLGYNNLSGVITEDHFAGLVNLKFIDLSHNNLEFVIDSHWVPPFNLEWAYFSSCHLGPKFPKWLGWQKGIIKLDISDTGLVGRIPYWFWTTFSNASSLDISLNQLTGELPLSLQFMSVTILLMHSNLLTGLIPELSRTVEVLDISRNSLNGFVPNFQAPSLQCAILFSNSITEIPTKICRLQKLQVLDLSNNLLSVELPDCGKKYLKHLYPSSNNSPSVNTTASFSLQITTLLLSNNSISSEFPSFLQQCTNLIFLDLTQNKFTGELPRWISEAMPGLLMLRLGSNNLYGRIPVEIMVLHDVRILDLSNNNFFGAITQYLGNLKALTTNANNEVSENPFEETYPPGEYEMGEMGTGLYNDSLSVVIKRQSLDYKGNVIYLMSIDFSCNSLTGEIPEELSSLAGLINLNLSSNLLTGNIPYNIGNLHSLESLDLSKNKLGGGIPQGLTYLTYLSYLNLSYNNLSGRIPSGHQLDILKADDPTSMYIGNPGLCGHPVPRECPGTPTYPLANCDSESWSEDGMFQMDFFLGSIVGFVAGTWMVFCGLLFMKRWRYAYFGLLDRLYDRLYVISVVTWRKWFRKTGGN